MRGCEVIWDEANAARAHELLVDALGDDVCECLVGTHCPLMPLITRLLLARGKPK